MIILIEINNEINLILLLYFLKSNLDWLFYILYLFIMNSKKLLEKIESAKNEFVNTLPKEELNKEKAKIIIKRQVAAFEWNFIIWLSSILITAKSNKAKQETKENLAEELKDNHAGLLRSFAKSWDSLPDKKDFEFLEKEIWEIRELISEMSGLKNLVLMTILEDTASDCMLYLNKAAKIIGATDTRYADMHYTLDLKHSQDFKDSLVEEIKYYDNNEELINSSIEKAIKLLKKIWTI